MKVFSKSPREIGKEAEDQALDWFLKHRAGSTLIARNFYCKSGEIDLIFEERGEERGNFKNQIELVFVEVRLCSPTNWLKGPEVLHWSKQKKFARASRVFLSQYQGKAQSVRSDLLVGDGKCWHHLPNLRLND